MGSALAIRWDGARNRATAALLALAVAAAGAAAWGAGAPGLGAEGPKVPVIVREVPGAGGVPEGAVAALGGSVGRHIGLIDGFVAGDGHDAALDMGSLYSTTKVVKAQDLWRQGITGAGVDVALIDTGVAPVGGVTAPGKIINGADLSFESQADDLRYLDSNGHGTFMAGMIAGRDDGVSSIQEYTNHDRFVGVAPDARILSVKVAGASGATDVSQVIAAIDWVVQHRNDNGMNVRVLNLSYGTDGTQDYRVDPLAYAAEVAWHRGIVVVVAAGNAGFGSAKLNNPAYDPYVIAVGANTPNGTVNTSDDTTPDWSSRGDGTRNPDFVAPGKSIVSLRVPNSYIDQTHAEGRVNSRFFRGSGTSQAAAVASGAAALLLQQRPRLSPDQVKTLLASTAMPLPNADPVAQGAGEINVKSAAAAPTPSAVQTWERSAGTGSLEAARGSLHLVDPNGVELRGEQDIFGMPWDGQSWSAQSWSGQSWSGGTWNGQSWSGQSWSGQSWSGQSWSGQSWSGQSWSGQSWSGQSWSGQSWSGQSWSSGLWGGEALLRNEQAEPAPPPDESPAPAPEQESAPTEPAPADEGTPAPEPSPEPGATTEPAGTPELATDPVLEPVPEPTVELPAEPTSEPVPEPTPEP